MRIIPSVIALLLLLQPTAALSVVAVPSSSTGTLQTFNWPAEETTSVWSSLVPPLWKDARGLDRKIQWHRQEQNVADRWLGTDACDARQVEQLAQAVEAMQAACSDYDCFKGRLVATRGSVGTKCPVWHLDHVPVRWIQALVGPGCLYVSDPLDVCWDKVNHLDDTLDPHERNRQLLRPNARSITKVPTGQAVVLPGTLSHQSPIVHKSPEAMFPWEGRVLLTMEPFVE